LDGAVNARDLERELDKIVLATRWAERHLTRYDEANAAVHMERPVYHSPLTSAMHEANMALTRLLDLAIKGEIAAASSSPSTPAPPSARSAATEPSRSARRSLADVEFIRSANGLVAWTLAHPADAPPPLTCPRRAVEAYPADDLVCCTLRTDRPLCHEALVACGVRA
jgi:hypothetical protein